jgi:hypothetical protein
MEATVPSAAISLVDAEEMEVLAVAEQPEEMVVQIIMVLRIMVLPERQVLLAMAAAVEEQVQEGMNVLAITQEIVVVVELQPAQQAEQQEQEGAKAIQDVMELMALMVAMALLVLLAQLVHLVHT